MHPKFAGCPSWAMPLLYQEYQVPLLQNQHLDICFVFLKPWNALQEGHSEEWLCSIFANLTEDLEIALQAAWHATMVVHNQCMRQADCGMNSFPRQAIAKMLGCEVEKVSDLTRSNVHPHNFQITLPDFSFFASAPRGLCKTRAAASI
jgi:hypothetical protein